MTQNPKTALRAAFWKKLARLITPMDIQVRIETHKMLTDALGTTKDPCPKQKPVEKKFKADLKRVSSAAL